MSGLPCEKYGSREILRITPQVSIHEEDVTGRRFVAYEDIGRGFDDRKALCACEKALLERVRATEKVEALHKREVIAAKIGALDSIYDWGGLIALETAIGVLRARLEAALGAFDSEASK